MPPHHPSLVQDSQDERPPKLRKTADPTQAVAQDQSLVFTKLPLDIRRHIYLEIWKHHGLAQHIYMFSPASYLSHYPCLLPKTAYEHHYPSPPQPKAPDEPEPPADDTDTEPEADGEAEDDGANDLYDDPGDINGAYQQLAAPHPAAPVLMPAPTPTPTPAPAPAPGPTLNANINNASPRPWLESPWCTHLRCYHAYTVSFGGNERLGYSRNYCRDGSDFVPERHKPGINIPLLVCKRMYAEASESLYSTMAFSFSDVAVLEHFMSVVPPGLSGRIQFADVMANVTLFKPTYSCHRMVPRLSMAGLMPTMPKQFWTLEEVSTLLRKVLPNVQQLRLCIHILRKGSGHTPDRAPLPNKQWFQPLYQLASELKERRLRKLWVQLVTKCDTTRRDAEDEQDWMTYGSTPKFLQDAPFHVVLVPQGYHPMNKPEWQCVPYPLDQNDDEEQEAHS